MSDGPAAVLVNSSGTEIATGANPVRTDPTGTTAQPVTDGGGSITVDAAALPLPTGAATETTLASASAKLPATLGQKAMAASMAVTLASDQSAVPITGSFSSTVVPNPTDTTGTITTIGGTVTATVQGWSSCMIVFTGTWTASLVFEVSSDGGATWIQGAFAIPPAVLSPLPGTILVATVNGTYQGIGMGAITNARVRASSAVTGTVNVRLVFGNAHPGIFSSFSSIQQNVLPSLNNNLTANLAAGASFTGAAESTLGVAGIQVNVKSSQPVYMQLQQSPDGANWDISDDQTFLAGQGDSRTFQATASYFRIVVTNLGNATTTYCRVQVALCPVVEALPRALTPHGRLRLSDMTTSWAPDPSDRVDLSMHRSLLLDTDRNLNVRARCLTDESSFRDDFTAADQYTDLTGTVYFTNGSKVVTGVGTLFTTELGTQDYLKLSSHADTAYASVGDIQSDTYLELDEPYTGATGSGTGRCSEWLYAIGTGGSIAQTGSEILLATGTTSGTLVQAKRNGDYPPYVIGFKARVTQRIANQELHVGLADANVPDIQSQTLVVFDGTTNTTAKLRTSYTALDVEETTFTLPAGAVTSTSNFYQLEVTPYKVTLFVNEVKVAEHKLHIPGPYTTMDCHVCARNTGTAGSTTMLALDTYFLQNFDRVEIASSAKGDPLPTKEMRATTPTVTSVTAAAADTLLLALNASRLGATIMNDSNAVLYVKFGSGASVTSYTVRMVPNAYYEVPFGYTGQVNGYWASANGAARVTEVV